MAADAVAVEPLKTSVRVVPAQFAHANRGVSGKVWTKSLNLSSGLQKTQCIMNQILQSYQAVHIAWLGNARAEGGGIYPWNERPGDRKASVYQIHIPKYTHYRATLISGISINKSDAKGRDTLGCLDQYTCTGLRLWNNRDRETV